MQEEIEGIASDEQVRIAMINSYDVIVKGMDAEGIIAKANGVSFFAHDFTDELKASEVQAMIDYFISTEEYLRCAKLDLILKTLSDE